MHRPPSTPWCWIAHPQQQQRLDASSCVGLNMVYLDVQTLCVRRQPAPHHHHRGNPPHSTIPRPSLPLLIASSSAAASPPPSSVPWPSSSSSSRSIMRARDVSVNAAATPRGALTASGACHAPLVGAHHRQPLAGHRATAPRSTHACNKRAWRGAGGTVRQAQGPHAARFR